ncbi:MAG: hydroxymethylpyrimidine/phosphomethylpyrimidine kinase [Enterococcus sp.]
MAKQILTIGGSDPFAGGGIQSDLKTFENHHLFGLSALTSIGVQTPGNTFQFFPVEAEVLAQQLASIASEASLAAIKIGYLHTIENIIVVEHFLRQHAHIPVVLDPVFAFKETATQEQADYIEHICTSLFPFADLITPNLIEASLIAQSETIASISQLNEVAKQIIADYPQNLLIKGGERLDGPTASDFLFLQNQSSPIQFDTPKLSTQTVNGAGCTLSSAIAANLALGNTLVSSVESSKKFVTLCIKTGQKLQTTGSVWSGGKSWEAQSDE